MYHIIMAGGSGARFWPLSNEKKPKQFLKLFDNVSLIKETYDRILTEFQIVLNFSVEDTQKKLDKALKRNLEKQVQKLENKSIQEDISAEIAE